VAKKRDLRKEKQLRNREYVKKLRKRTNSGRSRFDGGGDGGGYMPAQAP
jgi:hypothetical protein